MLPGISVYLDFLKTAQLLMVLVVVFCRLLLTLRLAHLCCRPTLAQRHLATKHLSRWLSHTAAASAEKLTMFSRPEGLVALRLALWGNCKFAFISGACNCVMATTITTPTLTTIIHQAAGSMLQYLCKKLSVASSACRSDFFWQSWRQAWLLTTSRRKSSTPPQSCIRSSNNIIRIL